MLLLFVLFFDACVIRVIRVVCVSVLFVFVSLVMFVCLCVDGGVRVIWTRCLFACSPVLLPSLVLRELQTHVPLRPGLSLRDRNVFQPKHFRRIRLVPHRKAHGGLKGSAEDAFECGCAPRRAGTLRVHAFRL